MEPPITLDNGQQVVPDWAKEVTMKKMAKDMADLSKTIEKENLKLIKAITGGNGSNSDANQASNATRQGTKNQKEQNEEIKKTTKEYSNMRGMSVSLGAAVGGAIGGLVSGVGMLTGAIMALTTDTLFKYTASLNKLTDVGLNQSDEFMSSNFRLRSLGLGLDEATDFAYDAAGAMQALGGESVNRLLTQFDALTGSGSDLGLTLQDSIDIFREEISFATRMGNIGRLDEKQRKALIDQTKDLLGTQLKYTGALGQSLETIRAFTLQMLESSSDFQSRLLLLSEDTRQEMIKGAQEFVSVLRATGGELGGELAAAAVEAASFGAIGFSEAAKRFVTVLPSLAGDFNSVVSGFNSGLLDGEEAAMMFTERLGTLSEVEKQRIFAIARTGDAQALVLAKGVMQFEKAFKKITDMGFEDVDPVQFQRTLNLLGATGTQLIATISSVKDKFITGFVMNIDYDKFNNSFKSLKNAVQSLAETFFGIEDDQSKVAEGLADKLPLAIDYATVRIELFNQRVQQFLDENKDTSFTEVFMQVVKPVLDDFFFFLTTEFMVFFNDMMHRVKNNLNPFGYYDENEFEEFLSGEKESTRRRRQKYREVNRVHDIAETHYSGSEIQKTFDAMMSSGDKTQFNIDTSTPGIIRPQFMGDSGGYRFFTDRGYAGNLSSVQMMSLGSNQLTQEEAAMMTKYKSLTGDDQAAYLEELKDMVYSNSKRTGFGGRPGDAFRSSFDADSSGSLDESEMTKYLETLIMLTKRQTRTIEDGNM